MKKSLIILLAGILIGGTIGYFIAPHKVEEVVVEKEIEKIVQVESKSNALAKPFLKKYIAVLEEANALPWNDENYYSTAGMISLAGQEYTLWDDLLNEIYQELKDVLDDSTMDELTNKQVEWIEYRDNKAEEAGKEVEGGSMYGLVITSSKAATTKERCFELIDLYME